jgi:hypothetical protein
MPDQRGLKPAPDRCPNIELVNARLSCEARSRQGLARHTADVQPRTAIHGAAHREGVKPVSCLSKNQQGLAQIVQMEQNPMLRRQRARSIGQEFEKMLPDFPMDEWLTACGCPAVAVEEV